MSHLGQERPEKVDRGLAHNGLTCSRPGRHGLIRWDPKDPTRRTTVDFHRKKLSRDEQKEIIKQARESLPDWIEKMDKL